MTRRRLRPDEVELWRQIAATTDRIHPELPRADDLTPRPKPKPHKTAKPRLPEFAIGQAARTSAAPHDLKPNLIDRLRSAPVSMDSKAFGRMKRGKLVPEARIDLHGMTIDRAHPTLTSFILRAQASGKRLVLVITGKGRDRDEGGPIPVPRGILKHQVPNWLSMPPLAQAVLQITEAHVSHGGAGAYYVYLRRHR
ncbi:Smr/MutS family protein [Seohaeicola saemankumensis]|uniref:Smr/MutS family protein n=1 Tax=Seohaeicola saemankumensis TaxID=481181 RepID=UPI001E444E3E|nr:Smr/MutS family protein [Seohaeicola saemankumensis]MCD1624977.1 Smr/MutS family protein [Seohaeicola saemankumensis]